MSNSTNGQATDTNTLDIFNSDGFHTQSAGEINTSAATYIAHTFRRSPKFFDVVTYTGNGGTNVINHALGVVPGMVVVKRLNGTSSNGWAVWHRSTTVANASLLLNSTAAQNNSIGWFGTPTSTTFTVQTNYDDVNDSASTYVAYLFAHDTGTDGLIQCGSFTTNGSGDAAVTLGWEPQYVLIKPATTTGDWQVTDSSRVMSVTGANTLTPNSSASESVWTTTYAVKPNATGFTTNAGVYSQSVVYMAIRAPMKVPTDATKVFTTILNSASGATKVVTGAGFAPDVMLGLGRTSAQYGVVAGRLRGHQFTATYSTAAEQTTNPVTSSWDMDGVTLTSDPGVWNINSGGGTTAALQLFKRAPGFMQEVCYTESGGTATVAHGLGVAPELLIFKARSTTSHWAVYAASLGATDGLLLNKTAAKSAYGHTPSGAPSATSFTVASFSGTAPCDALLFATCPGVSKVGSYTGTGTTLQINCGFAAGARFILIKRTDSTGDWYVWDSVRGIVSGNDPYLLLNSTAAEVTSTDYIDPYSAGFEISSSAPSAINASGGTFIFLAIA